MAAPAPDRPRGLAAGEERRTGAGLRAAGAMLERLIARSGHKRGFAEAGLLLDWRAIVGDEIAGQAVPERLARGRGDEGGVLHLTVAGAWALDIQHREPAILERINRFFGYRAVRRLALRQGTLPAERRHRTPAVRPLDKSQEQHLAAMVAEVEDPDLAAALHDLGRAVLGGTPSRRP